MRVKMAQRMLWLTVMMLLLMGALGYRLYGLQIVQAESGHDLPREAVAQRTQSLPLQMRRGLILDRSGVPLTAPQSSLAVGVFPRLLKDTKESRQALQSLLSPQQVEAIFTYRGPEPDWVLTGLPAPVAGQVQALRLPGIGVGSTGQRYGPESLARHLVGFANLNGGQMGLEKAFDAELYGERIPYLLATFDGRNRLLMGEIRVVQPQAGKEPYDLYTTLDFRIQQAVERELDRTRAPVGDVLRAGVVVLDVRTGEPLAIGSRPNYRQDEPASQEQWRNRALTAYEPGSVFKALVAAAALEEGKVSLAEEFTCSGHYELGAMRFHDASGKAHGRIPFKEAVAQSCNIAFIQVGYERLGADRLLQTAQKFGLGRPTGMLAGIEDAGLLPSLQYGGDVAQFSFGQGGLLATPLQVARAYAAIANGGVLPPVRLVTAVKKPSGEVIERPQASSPVRIISQETAREMQEALVGVTDPRGTGTGRTAWIEGVGAAGKTGSAETVQDGKAITHAWFAGWVPARQPRYVIAVLIENGQSGGLYAAPLFRRIGEALLHL